MENSLNKEVLLRSDDGAGSTDPDPSNGLCRCELVVLHHVACYQGPCPSKSGYGRRGERRRGRGGGGGEEGEGKGRRRGMQEW